MNRARCIKSIDRTHPESGINTKSTKWRNVIPSEVRYQLWNWLVIYNRLFIIVVYAILIDMMARGISPK
jgi:hypothetical protein